MHIFPSGTGHAPVPILIRYATALRVANSREARAYAVWDRDRSNRRRIYEWGRAAGTVDGLLAGLELVRENLGEDGYATALADLCPEDAGVLADTVAPIDRRRQFALPEPLWPVRGPQETDHEEKT